MAQSSRRAHRSFALAAATALGLGGLAVAGLSVPAHAAASTVAYALSGTNLLSFDPAKPSVTKTTALTGVNASETLVGIDVRPQNGFLYGVGVNAATDTATLYNLAPETGYATAVGSAGLIALTTDGSTPVDLPDPAAVGYGVDVNPAADRLRVSAGSLNFRVNPNTGTAVDGNNGGGVVTGTNPDGATNGGTTTVDAAAYTNNRANTAITTLYTLDAATNSLFIQNPPNAGTQTQAMQVTLGGSPIDFTSATGFDIDDSVNAPASSAAVASGSGYATLSVGGTTGLYRINLVNAQATYLGPIGTGSAAIQGLALQREAATSGRPIVALSADGFLQRFASNAPGTVTTQAIGALPVVGESLVALAWRPATGQLYALGINASNDTGTLYLLDPQTGGATAIGSPTQVAYTTNGTTPLDLPDPVTTGYGMDFDPATDRIRVATGTGLNFRILPSIGAALDGQPLVTGNNPDLNITGLAAGSTGLAGVAYTNSYGQPLTGGVRTLYGVDPAANQLVIVNAPNSGTVTTRFPLTRGGAALDVAGILAFDIPREVKVTASNPVASGAGFATFVVAGVTGLYSVDLGSAKVTSLGAIGTGATAVRSIAVGHAQAPPVVSPPAKAPATLSKAAAAKQVKATVDTGQVLKCPAAFTASTCTATVKVTVATGKSKGKVLGQATVKVAKGKSTRLTVKLTKAGKKFVKKKGKVKTTVAIAYPGGANATTRTVSFALTIKKSKL